jgi:hypothetical protein
MPDVATLPLLMRFLIMKLLVPFALAVVCCSAMAQESTDQGHINIEHYHYGMHLDIAKVISTTVPRGQCSISTITMIYQDSEGKIKGVEYMTLSPGCESTNS